MKNENYTILKKDIDGLFSYQFIAYLLLLVNTLLNTYLIFLTQKLIDAVLDNNSIIPILQRFSAVILIYLVETFIAQYFFRKTTILGENKVISTLYKKLLNKSITFFPNQNTGNLNSLLMNDATQVSSWMSSGMLIVFLQISTLIITLGLMIRYSLILTVILILLVIICFISTNVVANAISKATEKSYEIKGEINQDILKGLSSINIIKILKKEEYFYDNFSELVNNKKFKVDKKIASFYAIYISIYGMLSFILPFIAIGIGVWISANGNLSIGSVIAFYALVGRLQEPVRILAESISTKKVSMKLSDRLNLILKKENSDNDEEKIFDFQKLSVDVKSFSYDGKEILKNINFNLDPKDVLVIKGESGSGKTTLANLILGILRLEKGKIIINNKNIKDIDKLTWWGKVLIQGQDQLILEGTIHENLTLGDNYSSEEIEKAINVSCLKSLIEEKGLDSKVEEKGNNLSGGQKQRISLARILLRKPEILILDEPTSALDNETSDKLVKNIIEFSRENNICLVIISHRDDFDEYATKTCFVGNEILPSVV